MIFFIIFLIIPLIEIGLFAYAGGEIGVSYTLLLCLLTAMAGAVLIRQQGLHTLLSVRTAMEKGDLPLRAIFDGICLAVSGALLMTPGFFTDTIGFLLLIPYVRTLLQKRLAAHFDLNMPPPGDDFRPPQDSNIIEAEYETLEDEE